MHLVCLFEDTVEAEDTCYFILALQFLLWNMVNGCLGKKQNLLFSKIVVLHIEVEV